METTLQKINPQEIEFIRPLDELMKTYHSADKNYFCKLFQRKKQLIDNLMSIGIDSQKYFALVTKVYKSDSNQKDYAKNDLLLLRDIHKMNKETWFQQIVSKTQMQLTEQQNIYNQINSSHQQQSNNQNKSKPVEVNLNLNMTQITNFKVFDQLMEKYYQTPYRQTFIELYQKKQRIIDAIKSGKITPDLYFNMSQKALHDTKNEQVKKTLKTDLQILVDIHDGDKQRWLKQSVKETKSQDSKQKTIYELHKKGQNVEKIQFKSEIDFDNLTQIPIPNGTDPKDCISFTVLDRYMAQNKTNPEIYIELYKKKQALLQDLRTKKLNENTYAQSLKKKIESLKNQTLKQIYEIELNDIQDVHQGNLKQWFEHQVDETNISLMIQEDLYENMKKNLKPVPQKKPEVKPAPKKQQKQSDQSPLPFNPQKMYSLKILEDSILQFENNTQFFLKLFSQKQKIIEMMKNGHLDVEKYKKLQEKLLTQFANEQSIKDQIELDLSDIEDFHDGDLGKWFQETVEKAGQYYETQLAKYQQLTKDNRNQAPQKEVIKPKQVVAQKVKKQEKPEIKVQDEVPSPFNIQKMFSLKVLDDTLADCKNNDKLYIKVFSQKQKILDLMKDGKLDATKYKKLQEKMMQDFKNNEQITDSISFQLDEINDLHDGNLDQWFQDVVETSGTNYEFQLQKYQQLVDKLSKNEKNTNQTTKKSQNLQKAESHQQKVTQSLQKQFESKLSEASAHVNQSSAKSKIRFYLNEMAPYESLVKYYQKHELDPNKNPMLKIYLNVPRHEIEQIIQKIKNDSTYDIVSYCNKFFPPITAAIFYRGAQISDEKLQYGIRICNKEIQSLKQYSKLLRKGVNVKNLQKAKSRIQICMENINYLNDLTKKLKNSNNLIPLPLIEQIPVNYPNVDQNTTIQPNEVQLKILRIQGLDGEQFMKVYFDSHKIKELNVKNGNLDLNFKEKIDSPEKYLQVQKGDLKCFSISIYKKGWFSNTKLGQQPVEMMFIRTNIQEGKVSVGNATIFYQARVRSPKNPLQTEIKEVKITKYPPYEHSKQVEQSFIKKYAPLGNQK